MNRMDDNLFNNRKRSDNAGGKPPTPEEMDELNDFLLRSIAEIPEAELPESLRPNYSPPQPFDISSSVDLKKLLAPLLCNRLSKDTYVLKNEDGSEPISSLNSVGSDDLILSPVSPIKSKSIIVTLEEDVRIDPLWDIDVKVPADELLEMVQAEAEDDNQLVVRRKLAIAPVLDVIHSIRKSEIGSEISEAHFLRFQAWNGNSRAPWPPVASIPVENFHIVFLGNIPFFQVSHVLEERLLIA